MPITKNKYKTISDKDMKHLEKIANSYNMTLVELGHALMSNASGSVKRYIRLNESEYKYIKDQTEKHNTSIRLWCSLAIHAFLMKRKDNMEIFSGSSRDKGNIKSKVICVVIQNQREEMELLEIAEKYSIGVSALVRYCVLNFDGKEIC